MRSSVALGTYLGVPRKEGIGKATVKSDTKGKLDFVSYLV